jgi:hypothetical protein
MIRPWRPGPGRLVGRPRLGGAWQKVTDKERLLSLSVVSTRGGLQHLLQQARSDPAGPRSMGLYGSKNPRFDIE